MSGWLTLRNTLFLVACTLGALIADSSRRCNEVGGRVEWPLNGCRTQDGTKIEIPLFGMPEDR